MRHLSRRSLLQAGASLTLIGLTPLLAGTLKMGAGGAAAARTVADKRPIVHQDGLKFGAYDPHGDFATQTSVVTEALFLPWEDVDLSSLDVADAYAQARQRNLLITVEPWSWDAGRRLTAASLQQKILDGRYDDTMRALAAVIGRLKSPVTVRWGQEMEDQTGRFSWAGWEPRAYVSAYRRMMTLLRQTAPQAQRMWSPKGLPGLKAYYPGADQVDLVGLSVFGLQPYDERVYGAPRSFVDTLRIGYGLVEGFGKPVWVAELGYEGGDAYLNDWREQAALARPEFPALQQVVYFNDREVHPWPYNLGLPNWRVVEGDTTN